MKFTVKPKKPRYQRGKLYRVWMDGINKRTRFYTKPEMDVQVGWLKKGDIVMFIDEPEWGLFKLIHGDQIGWALVDSFVECREHEPDYQDMDE